MKAVILAAGGGIRIRPISDNLPKPLIKVGDKTLIEYTLIALANVGIKEAIIVIGHLGDKIKEHIGNSYGGLSIKYALNEDYSTTGTMYSFYKSKHLVDDDIILLECDLLFDDLIIHEVMSSNYEDLIVVSNLTNTGDEVLVSSNDKSTISNIGKKIQKNNFVGEFIGISKFSQNYAKKFFSFVSEKYFKNRDLNGYYEDYFIDFSKDEGLPMHYLAINDLVWTDIDNESDLEYAKKEIFPKLNLSQKNKDKKPN